MDSIQQRYHFEKQVLSTPNGILHEGKDLSLQRHVFLYEIRENKQSSKEETKRLLGSVSHFASPSFFHMLDLDEGTDGVYAVLEYRSGSPLLPLLAARSLSLPAPQILHMLIELGEAHQDALEERIRGFSVTAENIWLEQDQLMVINYWAEGDKQQRGVIGFVHLLYQLLLQTSELPADQESIEKKLAAAVEASFPEKINRFSKLIKRALNGHESLSSFLLELQDMIKPDQTLVHEEAAEPVKELQDIPDPEQQKPRFFSKKTALSGALLLLFVLGAAYYGLVGSKEPTPAAAPVAPAAPVEQPTAEKPTPVTDETAEVPPPIEIEEASLPSSDSTIIVANLHGLSKEEAEQWALANGLHYKFFMEQNELQQGYVFKQEPESGTEVPKGGYLTFWVSKGSAPQ